MKLKKFASFLGFVLTLCFAAGCAQSAPTEPGFDATKLPFYVEDTDSLNYSYTARERIQPFWQGNVIYNEQIMVVKKDGKTEGRLLYDAKRVISVRDWTLEKEYEAGKDYMIEGDTITLPAGSSIPVFDDEWSRGVNVPEVYPEGNAGTGYVMIGDGNSVMYTETGLIYKNYIHVTYVYDPAAADRSNFKKFSDELYGLSQKIGKKEDIEMVVFGDSISEGHSSSELWGHAPYSPPYAKLVKEGLELFGGVKVGYENISKGGMDSSWAADEEQLAKLTSLAPDLLLVAFGTNDSLNNLEGKTYRVNIEKIIETAKAANSECQILLIAPFPSNEKVKSAQSHELICRTLQSISESCAAKNILDVAYVSLYEGVRDMLETKNYYEVAGNNANHPNDFIHRFYAMNILSAIFDFDALAAK